MYLGLAALLIVVALGLLTARPAAAQDASSHEADAIYITQMDTCLPADALSRDNTSPTWKLIDYETETLKGSMVAAASYVEAPDLTLPLNVSGWHRIFIGYWNPEFDWDEDPIIEVRLSDQPAFRIFRDEGRVDRQDATFLREAYFDEADLTRRDVVFGKANGLVGHKAYLAYVKLVPLDPDEAAAIVKDRADNTTRRLIPAIDGASYFHMGEFRTEQDILAQVELYRHSDVARVMWAVCYGDWTNIPSEVEGTQFVADTPHAAMVKSGLGGVHRVRGENQEFATLAALRDRGTTPQQIAAKHLHSMDVGIEFDLMFRMGILGRVPGWRHDDGLVSQHPELRQRQRDGTVIEKASYAYPEVQQLMLDLIAESTRKIEADGVNLCFTRGPHFLWYDGPILEAFQAKYGEDAREVEPTDPRLLEVRASFMTDFMRNVRQVLDEVGEERGQRLTLSVWVWPTDAGVWLGGTPMEEGLDVVAWIREGLLDGVVSGNSGGYKGGIDPAYVEAAAGQDVMCALWGHIGDASVQPETVTKAHDQGVEYFAWWDMDFAQTDPARWAWLRRIGHVDEMRNWDPEKYATKSIQLHKIDDVDVLHGMAAAVYSGG